MTPPALHGPQFRARLKQLAEDGLLDHYRCAREFKTELFPALPAPAARPLLGSLRCPPGHAERHLRQVAGELPASGFFELRDCHVGKAGTLLDPDRRVLYDDDLLSSYWMWFVGKLIQKAGQRHAKPVATIDFLRGETRPVERIDTGGATLVSLCKPGHNVYGHWILDTLPMAWNLFEAVRLGALAPPFRFLVSAHTPAWARGFLSTLFDVAPADIVSFDDNAGLLHCERLIVPSLLRVSPLISPRMNAFVEFVFRRMGLAPDMPGTDLPRDIYISRRDFAADSKRTLINADAIEALMRTAGITPLQPEKLPWREQLALFMRTRLLVGEFGSGMHNALFCPPSATSIVLINHASNWNQSSIAALRGQELVCVGPDVEEKVGAANGRRFSYAPDDLHAAIDLARATATP